MSSHTTRTDLPKSDNEIACCAIGISASSFGERRSWVNPQTTGYLNWHIADTAKFLGVLVSLAPLAKPMVIDSKYMSLSQTQKELWPF